MNSQSTTSIPNWLKLGKLESVELFRIKAPLAKPYKLSFANLKYFETIWCRVVIDGEPAWGETCPLAGYGWESIDNCWRQLIQFSKQCVGKQTNDAFLYLLTISDSHPFAVCTLLSSFEWPHLSKLLSQKHQTSVVKALGHDAQGSIVEQAAQLIEQGYRCFKLKVGGQQGMLIEDIKSVLKIMPEDSLLRLDGNQALSYDEAAELWRNCDHPSLEHMEQPFAKDNWQASRAFLKSAPNIRLCLDESVWTLNDIEKIKELGVPVSVKLKLMKHGSPSKTVELINAVIDIGCQVIFGNGVQTEIGSLAEMAIQQACGLEGHMEFNGFDKLSHPLLIESVLSIKKGWMYQLPLIGEPKPGNWFNECLEDHFHVNA